jgi:hypothetical protein
MPDSVENFVFCETIGDRDCIACSMTMFCPHYECCIVVNVKQCRGCFSYGNCRTVKNYTINKKKHNKKNINR